MMCMLQDISDVSEIDCVSLPAYPVIIGLGKTISVSLQYVRYDSTSTICGDACPFHASVLRPTSWPNARDRREGEVN